MTDIVKQLRNLAEYSNDVVSAFTTNPTLLVEAADEIARLRNEEKKYLENIERLQLELQAAKFCVNVHISERNIARLHVERLEEANAKLRESKHEHSNDR